MHHTAVIITQAVALASPILICALLVFADWAGRTYRGEV